MRKIAFCILILPFFIVSIFSNTVSAEFKKTKIAVMDFQLQGEGFETQDMGKIVAEWLITALVKEGRFDVIERRLLNKVLEEQRFTISGVVDQSTVSKLGKILGVKVIIAGTVIKLQNVMEANARIIDVENASVIAAENVKSTNTIKLEDLVAQMAQKIIQDFPLECYIVQRVDDKVVIDLGKFAGVKVGMQFIVFREGSIIKHPKTGEVLDVETIETGTIQIKDVKDKTSWGVITKESGSNLIKSGLMVKSMVELIPLKSFSKIEETDVMSKLRDLDLLIDEAQKLKDSENAAWKIKIKTVFGALKQIFAQNRTSPEVYLYYAKAYYVADNMRKAEKMLQVAFSYKPQYIDAYIFKGNMYYHYARTVDVEERQREGYDKTAIDAYDLVIKASEDKSLHATMYFKIGDVHADLNKDMEKAKEFWQKTISIAPDSKAAKLANERLKAK